jgi:hypothetical protein
MMVLAAMLGILAGCGTGTKMMKEQEETNASGQKSKVEETGAAEKEPREEGMPATENVKSTEGKFIGIVDTTSIEVEVNGEPKVFQVSDTVKDAIPQLEEGIIIQFSYSENEHGQSIIEYIQ